MPADSFDSDVTTTKSTDDLFTWGLTAAIKAAKSRFHKNAASVHSDVSHQPNDCRK